MPTSNRKLRVFLCHSSKDKPVVRELHRMLLGEGWIEPWLDEEKLLPGQDWDMEIEKAVEASEAVIVCLSEYSVNKEGYLQKEIRRVLDVADQKPEGTIFIIPLRLDDCQPPRQLAKWQYVNYYPPQERDVSYQRLLKSLKIRQERLAVKSGSTIIPKNREALRAARPQNRSDHHSALASKKLLQTGASGVTFVTAKLQWGKEDIGYSLHAGPSSYSTAGMQTTDFLAYLGFKRETCSYIQSKECYAAWIDSEFELSAFASRFDEAYGLFEKANRRLESCIHILDQPEGWGYFYGKSSSGTSHRSRLGYSTDGHTANKSEMLKQSEDDNFHYRMSWIESAGERGWVFHYSLKDGENRKILPALRFLHLSQFKECPYFDFEDCYWMYIQHEHRGDSFFEGNANIVHSAFASHEKNFSAALEILIESNDLVSPFGFHFLDK
jgi:TIR domain-containing protein